MTSQIRLLISLVVMSICMYSSVYSQDTEAKRQKVRVVNGSIPIPFVAVINISTSEHSISDADGKVLLPLRNPSDTLVFRSMGYEDIIILPGQIIGKFLPMYESPVSLEEVQILSNVVPDVSINLGLKRASTLGATAIKNGVPPGNTAELLQSSGQIHIQQSQQGGGSPVLRGFEANRVLLVVDGVRMNNAIYRSGHLQNSITINPNSLERTEVIYGPSSVGYGSDALGGVVHYYTKTPKINNSNKWLSRGVSSYNSRLNNIVQNLDFEHSTNKWASYTNFSFSKFGDIVMGNNRNHGFDDWGLDNHYLDSKLLNSSEINNDDPNTQLNTAYSQFDFMQKFNILLSESSNMIVNFQHSKSSNINRFDKLNEIKNGDYKYSEWYYGPQKRTMISTHFNFSKV